MGIGPKGQLSRLDLLAEALERGLMPSSRGRSGGSALRLGVMSRDALVDLVTREEAGGED